MRNFICRSIDEKKMMHMVNWNTVSLPEELGGLGLYSLKYRNQAVIEKLCWRLAGNQEAPWARILAAKYLTPRRIVGEGRNLPCSSIWNSKSL